MTEFGVETHVEEKSRYLRPNGYLERRSFGIFNTCVRFYMGSHAPHCKRRNRRVPNNFVIPIYAPNGVT